ncbi:CoA protein activase [Chloroflexota bacterium]
MRIGMPQAGNLHIPFKTMFQRLDVDYTMPPPISQRTMSLGARYSPEGSCLPFKLTLGSIIEAAERGADTMLMIGGYGICRLGYYSTVQEQILHEMGYNVEMIKFGVSEHKLSNFLNMIKRFSNNASWLKIISAFRFGLAKLNALDKLEQRVQKVRATELTKGTANQLYTRFISQIDAADSYRTLNGVKKDYAVQLNKVARDTQVKPLVVGIVGEIYVLLEPFSNLDIEKELGKLGVEVKRRLFFSEWMKFSLFLNPLGISEVSRIHRAALPYLKRDIGGEGWESVGEKVLHAKDYDGLIHLAPFTCMPEIVAQNIMQTTKETIPVLTIICDEQLAKPGMLTRLEAFVDLLKRKQVKGNNRL